MKMRFSLLLLALGAALWAQTPAKKNSGPIRVVKTPLPGYLEKTKMTEWVRHYKLYPPQVNLEVSNPVPSDVPGLLLVNVKASMGAASESSEYYITRDGMKLVEGKAFDSRENPFKKTLDKLRTDGAPSLGTPGAPVVIVLFSDFQCSYCKKEAEIVRKELLKAFPTQVRVYFKDYPLESIHPWARTASVAGRCVQKQKEDAGFWAFHDAVFADQEKITNDNLKEKLKEHARTAGADVAAFEACLADKTVDAMVTQSAAEGRELGVSSTPTMFINGRSIPGSLPWPNLKQIIELEANYQVTAKNAGEHCCTLPSPSLLSMPPNPILAPKTKP
ncbi:MAG: thioredoxin domain-containing protein [Bryobacterales bacterium]|nr:thioredoxin domain-containing protein [Bryobacterales bacterium]